MTNESLFRHLWLSYEATIDGKQTYGDVGLLAEAAERMEWPGAPEMGRTIATVLRKQVIKDKNDIASKHHKVVRNSEILKLARLHADAKMTQTESHELIAGYFNMTPDAVRKTIEREGSD